MRVHSDGRSYYVKKYAMAGDYRVSLSPQGQLTALHPAWLLFRQEVAI